MSLNVGKEVAALQRMTVRDLRARIARFDVQAKVPEMNYDDVRNPRALAEGSSHEPD